MNMRSSAHGSATALNARPTFGARVAVIDRLLGGEISRAAACEMLALPDEQLDKYLREHARDRLVFLDEFRMPSALGPHAHELWSRARQLESQLRDRHRELVMLRQIARGRGLI